MQINITLNGVHDASAAVPEYVFSPSEFQNNFDDWMRALSMLYAARLVAKSIKGENAEADGHLGGLHAMLEIIERLLEGCSEPLERMYELADIVKRQAND